MFLKEYYAKLNSLLLKNNDNTKLDKVDSSSTQAYSEKQNLFVARKYSSAIIEILLNAQKVKLKQLKNLQTPKKSLQKYKITKHIQKHQNKNSERLKRHSSLPNLSSIKYKELVTSDSIDLFNLNNSKEILAIDGYRLKHILLSKNSEIILFFFADYIDIYYKHKGIWENSSTIYIKKVIFFDWFSEDIVVIAHETSGSLYPTLSTINIKSLQVKTIEKSLNLLSLDTARIFIIVGSRLVILYNYCSIAVILLSETSENILSIFNIFNCLQDEIFAPNSVKLIPILNSDNLVALVDFTRIQIFNILTLQKSPIFDFKTVNDAFYNAELFSILEIADLTEYNQNPNEDSIINLLSSLHLSPKALKVYDSAHENLPYISVKTSETEISIVNRFTGLYVFNIKCTDEIQFLSYSLNFIVASTSKSVFICNFQLDYKKS
ncbi:hypothetical protein BB561_002302 [Smittium simulii]|uniref:Uncharacterized protein n=1 Tax=Smittium simulii TaxID=133385 RepID=A0A2T9YQY1_9FUNG|nr:hypothetical protein BB561_002302 [Smittium simulii]